MATGVPIGGATTSDPHSCLRDLMTPRRAPSTRLVAAAAVWALVVGGIAAVVGAEPDLWFHLAVWVPLVALLPRVLAPGVERSWRLMAAGIVLFALGDVAWDVILATGASPDASGADLVYLSGYVALGAGVAALLRVHGGPGSRDGLLDGVLLAIPAAVLITQFLVVPGDVDGSPLAVRVVTALYPLADTVLVAAVVWLLVTPGIARRVSALMVAGMVTTLVIDVTWAAAALAGDETLSRVADGLFPLSYALLAGGVATGAATAIEPLGPSRRVVVPWGRVALLATGLVAAPMSAALAVVFDGQVQPVLVVAATLVAATLVVLRFVHLVNDLNRTTEQLSAARNEIMEQAVLDPLTGAYNRMVLPEQLEGLAVGRHASAAVLSIDLDRFKQINDEWGHHAGDVVLGAVAERLRGCTRGRDVVIRMGGDEFLVISHDVDGPDALQLAERIVAEIERPVEFAGHGLSVSASVGVAMVPAAGDDHEDLLHRADQAMYLAKRSASQVQLAPS